MVRITIPVGSADLAPSVEYPKESLFAKRLALERPSKQAVAIEVLSRLIAPGTSMFIGDGSGSYYVGLGILRWAQHSPADGPRWHIGTNSLAIHDEFVFGPLVPNVEIETARGLISRPLCAVHGPHAVTFAKDAARESACTVLTVNALFALQGPHGVDYDTSTVKEAVMHNPFKKLILVTDHTKLARIPGDNESRHPVFTDLGGWRGLTQNANFYIFTTRYPGAPSEAEVATMPFDLEPEHLARRDEPTRYAFQAKHLRALMKDRFIEVPSPSRTVPSLSGSTVPVPIHGEPASATLIRERK